MKKFLFFTVFIIGSVFSFFIIKNRFTKYCDYSKIVYELNGDFRPLTDENNEEDQIESKKVLVQVLLDYEKPSAPEKSLDLNDDEAIEAYRAENFEFFQRYHFAKNRQLFSSIKVKGYDSMYCSEYTPFIEFTFNKDAYYKNSAEVLSKATSNKNVEKVYIREYADKSVKDNLIGSLISTNSIHYFNNRIYTGSGVKVGLLEGGIIDTSNDCISGSSYEIYNHPLLPDTATEHATQMASIIGGNYGIAPDVTIYSAELYGSITQEVDWMLSKGVNIINMSFGDRYPNGVYGSCSAQADYIVNTYCVLIVAAAGNEGDHIDEEYVANPGLGYNVITVGSNTTTGSISDFSSYKVVSGPFKPTICVPGEIVIPHSHDMVMGTSVSAAITTGLLALYLEENPAFKVYRQEFLATIVANAEVLDGLLNYGLDNGFSDKCGAGELDFTNMLNNYVKSWDFLITDGSQGVKFNHKIRLNKGEKVTVAMAWFAYADGTKNGTTPTDYDLQILSGDLERIVARCLSYQNIEVLHYTAPETGYYYISCDQAGLRASPNNERIGIAWRIES